MTLTKAQARKRIRSLRSRAAANRRVSSPGYDGTKATEKMRSAFWRGYCLRVDPDGRLTDEERMARAKRLWHGEMCARKADKLERRIRALKAG